MHAHVAEFKAVAPTLPYDVKIIAAHHRGRPLSPREWAAVGMPTLVAFGTKSPDWISNGMRELAGALPDGRCDTLPGQNHMIKPEVLAPTLIEFFADSPVASPLVIQVAHDHIVRTLRPPSGEAPPPGARGEARRTAAVTPSRRSSADVEAAVNHDAERSMNTS